MNKINTFFRNKKTIILICIFVGLICIFFGTYALEPELFTRRIITKILRIDEDVYGDTILDTSELDLRPILDKNMETSIDNVIHIEFTVGGSNLNNVQNIVYDIALADLEIDCDLISPYVKWKLLKNGEFISEGSLDYKFDTIIDGRLVLTPIQQDLKEYSEDKTTYDNYDFAISLLKRKNEDIPINRLNDTKERSNSYAQNEQIRYGAAIYLTRDDIEMEKQISWKEMQEVEE